MVVVDVVVVVGDGCGDDGNGAGTMDGDADAQPIGADKSAGDGKVLAVQLGDLGSVESDDIVKWVHKVCNVNKLDHWSITFMMTHTLLSLEQGKPIRLVGKITEHRMEERKQQEFRLGLTLAAQFTRHHSSPFEKRLCVCVQFNHVT